MPGSGLAMPTSAEHTMSSKRARMPISPSSRPRSDTSALLRMPSLWEPWRSRTSWRLGSMARWDSRHSSWSGGRTRPARASSAWWAASSQAWRSPRPRSMAPHVSLRYSVSNTEERGKPCVRSRSRATSQRMSHSTPPKSKITPRRLILALGGALVLRGVRSLDGRPDVSAEGDPAAVLHAALVEDLRLLVGARGAVPREVGGGVVLVRLVPLLVRHVVARGGEDQGGNGEEGNQSRHAGHDIMPGKMLDTTIAGSLPKPAWLATPRTLWAPWHL